MSRTIWMIDDDDMVLVSIPELTDIKYQQTQMESSEFTLRRILDSSRGGVLRDIKYELKEAVDTKTECGKTITTITHWIEATINGRVMPHKGWIESGYTGEHADRHKEMVMRGRDKVCQEFIKYLIEYGVQKLQESVIWEWDKAKSINE